MKKVKIKLILLTLLAFYSISNAQYYSGINPESTSFISDLETLIRNNYHKVTYANYKNDIIPNYESYDNGDGTRSVVGVYSGFIQVYTPPFAWTPTTEMSREHTFAYSWMPTHGSKSTDEYSDRHHLFPVNQNKANVVRSNHPLGIVQNVTSQYLGAKVGTDVNGATVYEPRDRHKGDAARAILYMLVRYDGVGGNRWTINWLNNTRLPSINEAPEDLNTLLLWNKQDPPDKWEVERNDYIETLQNNRNPFVDHPEYVNYIDFNDLSKLSPVYAAEPSNQLQNFTAASGGGSVTLSWTDAAAGSQAPSGYLLMGYDRDNYFIPIDGEVYTDDSDLSDGAAVVNIDYSASDSYTFTNLSDTVDYYFYVYSYNGAGTQINYNLEGTIPSAHTIPASTSSFGDLLFTKYIEGTSSNKALEVYNNTGSDINLQNDNYTIEIYFNGNTTAGSTISLTGTIANASTFVIAHSSASAEILAVADMTTGSLSFNGDDAVILKKGVSIIDAIGQIGFDPGTEWGTGLTSTADNTLHRKHGITGGDTNPNDAFDPATEWDGYPTDDISGLGESDPLPVELKSFTATIKGNNVELNWVTATEVNNYGFQVERKSMQSESGWEEIGFVQGHGNSNSVKYYSYIDNPFEKGSYSYRLKQIDLDGAFKYSGIVSVDLGPVTKFALKQNYPNPFNPTTEISFDVPKESTVKLSVYNTLGQKVADLLNEKLSAGTHRVKFDGSNLTSGIYFYKMQSAGFTSIKKMILMK